MGGTGVVATEFEWNRRLLAVLILSFVVGCGQDERVAGVALTATVDPIV